MATSFTLKKTGREPSAEQPGATSDDGRGKMAMPRVAGATLGAADSRSSAFQTHLWLVASGRSAHGSRQVVFSKKARSHELLRPPLPAGSLP